MARAELFTKDVKIPLQLDRIEDNLTSALPDHPGWRLQERRHRKFGDTTKTGDPQF